MLGGVCTHNVDDKGRVVIPIKFKQDLGINFIITGGFDKGSLMIMSYAEWDRFLARLEEYPMIETRRLKRYFHGNKHDVSTDKQGRMQIPQQLREMIGVKDEVVIVGNGEMAEIWEPSMWEEEELNITNKEVIATMSALKI